MPGRLPASPQAPTAASLRLAPPPYHHVDIEDAASSDCSDDDAGPLVRRSRPARWRDMFASMSPLADKQKASLLGSRASRRPLSLRAARGRFSLCGRLCIALPIVVLCMLGVVQILETILGLGSSIWDVEHDDFWPDWGQPGRPGDGRASYPTDLTRDVVPVPCHSHNDYWRRIPLYQALHFGCTGVEADVWQFAGHDALFVGHNTASLTRNRTFQSLYVDPLVHILDRQNPSTPFANVSGHGVFDEDPSQTLVLLVDFKTDGPALLPSVYAQLEPLRSKGYLSYYDAAAVKTVRRAITVVATGNAPFDLLVANSTYRDIFFDAPLAAFGALPFSPSGGQGSTGTDGATADSFSSANSYYASANFDQAVGPIWGGRLSPAQLRLIREQVQGARQHGLHSRYWNTPSWPIGLRNHVWDVLVREGVDYLNVDDLKSATRRDWSRRRGGWRWK